MRRTAMGWIGAGMMVMVVACANDEGTGPLRSPAIPERQGAVLPASAYKLTLYAHEGRFEDVNDRNLAVGFGDGAAIALPLGGAVHTMSHGNGNTSEAFAVNNVGTIVGRVSSAWAPWVDPFPAVWRSYTTPPRVLKDTGTARDVNDADLVVGEFNRKGGVIGFAWDLRAGTLDRLPGLPGYRQSTAVAVNNDRIILGAVGNGTTWQTVLWRHNGTTWVAQVVNGGIQGFDIDHGMGIVGRTGNVASFGTPDHAGYFNVMGPSYVDATYGKLFATGTDYGAAPGWPTYNVAFISDYAGNTTYLPDPGPGTWRASFGQGVNRCGLVVGTVWMFPGHPYTAQPAVWDPGC